MRDIVVVSIGCDIVKIAKMEQILKYGNFINFFTEKEQLICSSMNDKRKIEWLAGRFAAKEAIYKSINSHYSCTLRDIEILSDEKGMPCCKIIGISIYISISHEDEYAIAYAIAYKDI